MKNYKVFFAGMIWGMILGFIIFCGYISFHIKPNNQLIEIKPEPEVQISLTCGK